LVEDDGDEGGGEDQERVAEGEAQERAGGIAQVVGYDEVVFAEHALGFRRAERNHGVVTAAGTDADFYSEESQGVEEGDCERDDRRYPEVGLKDSGEGEHEGDEPEGGLSLEAAVGGFVFVADVEAVGAEFVHQGKG